MKHRLPRINELIKRELSAIIAREIDFEGALVSINGVNVGADLKNAHVFVSVLGGTGSSDIVTVLEAHRPTLQSELGRRVSMKYTPHLIFHLDKSIERGSRVIEILREIESPRGNDE